MRIRDGGGETISNTGAEKSKTAETKKTPARASGRLHDPKSQVSSKGSGGEYRAEGTDRKESADKSTELSGKDTEGLATEEEAEAAGGLGGGQRDADSDGSGITRKQSRTAHRPAGATPWWSPPRP